MGWFRKSKAEPKRISLVAPWQGHAQTCPLCDVGIQDPKWHAATGMVRCRCWDCGCIYEAPLAVERKVSP